MKRSHAAFICFLAANCSTQVSTEKALPQCWNVNNLEVGLYSGHGVFTTSMEGLSVQAPACDDRSGRNDFELTRAVTKKVDNYLAQRGEVRFIGFSFNGRIERAGMQKRLVIERIGQMRGIGKPQWMMELEQSYGRDRVTQ